MKRRCNLLLALAMAGTMCAHAQVRIGGDVAPNPSAILDLNPDDQTAQGNATSGLAMPRVNLVTTVSAVPLAAHIHGMTIFNMATQNDVTPGIYYNDGSKWVRLSSGETQMTAGVNEGDVLSWNATASEWEAQPEKDGIVGNEVIGAADASLMRSGSGTAVSPYTLAVSSGGIETKHLKDGSITNNKIVDKTISKEKLSDEIWNQVKTEITNSAVLSEVDGIVGNEVIGSADASLTRSGGGTAVSPYKLAVSVGGVETIHLKEGAVTTEKIANNAVTSEKIINNAVTKEKLGSDVWTQIVQTVKNEETDGIVGNEVVGAADASLMRSGSGTAVSPYTLAVSPGGIETKHLKDGSITNNKIVDKTISIGKLGDDVWNQVKTEITNSAVLSEVDGIVGNEVIGSADASLTRSGSGTAVSPYRLAVSVGGIETAHLKDGAVTAGKITNNAITTEKIINNAVTKEKLGNDIWNQIAQTVKNEEMDGIIGNEVTGATDGSLTRSGSGTPASPYTLAISAGGVETKHLKDNAISIDKIAKAPANSVLYTNSSGEWETFSRKAVSGVFNVPNDSLLTRCALSLPDFGAGLYGIHIVCDNDLPLPEGEITPSFFRFITDTKPYGIAGTRDLYFDSMANFSNGDSHTTTAWLYDCKPLELELYCRNSATKPVNFRIVCTWLMPF